MIQRGSPLKMKNPPYPPFPKGGFKSPPLAKGDLGGFEVFMAKLLVIAPVNISLKRIPSFSNLPTGREGRVRGKGTSTKTENGKSKTFVPHPVLILGSTRA
jgi:hypothetical protein